MSILGPSRPVALAHFGHVLKWHKRRPYGHILSGRIRAIDAYGALRYDESAGWSSLVARWAHNPKVEGSNPSPATNFFNSLRTTEKIKVRSTHIIPHISFARMGFCRPPKLTIYGAVARIRSGSPDSSDPQARSHRCRVRGARPFCRKKLESRFASLCAAVQLWSFPWHQPVPLHSFLRRKQPAASASRSPRFGGGAAIRPDPNISASVAFCATAAPRSAISSQGIPRRPHSEAPHGA